MNPLKIFPYTRRKYKKIKRMNTLPKGFHTLYQQGMRESNSHQRFWRPLSYHLTNPLRVQSYYSKSHPCCLSLYLQNCTHATFILFASFQFSGLLSYCFLQYFGQALTRLVAVSSTYHYASTSALSTSSSSRGFTSFEWETSS